MCHPVLICVNSLGHDFFTCRMRVMNGLTSLVTFNFKILCFLVSFPLWKNSERIHLAFYLFLKKKVSTGPSPTAYIFINRSGYDFCFCLGSVVYIMENAVCPDLLTAGHHFMANRWGNSRNNDRRYFLGFQNHWRW